jgi:hypothetical protein
LFCGGESSYNVYSFNVTARTEPEVDSRSDREKLSETPWFIGISPVFILRRYCRIDASSVCTFDLDLDEME